MAHTFEYIAAKNDPDGNPQRGWIVRRGHQVVAFVNEGYNGGQALRNRYPEVGDTDHTHDTVRRATVSEYDMFRTVFR